MAAPRATQLLDAKGDAVAAITAALRGAGGYGKTTLAKALAHDPDIQDAYFDGILWAVLGEKPNARQIVLDQYWRPFRAGLAGDRDLSTRADVHPVCSTVKQLFLTRVACIEANDARIRTFCSGACELRISKNFGPASSM
jgi:predicted ATPase